MKLDWSSLRLPGEDNTEDEEEEPISDPFKGTDAATGITVEADAGVIPNGTALRVTPVAADAPGYGVAKNVLADIGTDFALYDIKLTGSDGVTIQPQNNGAVRVSLPVPSGMDAAKIAVYRIDDGGKSLCPSGVDGGVLWFTTDHFSLFAIVERAVETTNTTHPDNKVAEPGNKDGDKGASAQKAAKKKARTVKIKFSANGGAVSVKNDGKSAKVKSVTKKLTVGKKYGSLPKATRDGLYRFKGWYTKKSGGKKVTKATIMKYKKATTLYAHWEAVYGQLNEGVYVVRLRATAGTDSSVKGYVGRQAKFRVISRTKDSNWYKVNYENKLGVKVTGYVYAGLVGTYWDDLKR
jgi:uncharacterized repeat protein (TIGR02543 family)